MLVAGFAIVLFVAVAALVLALIALRASRPRPAEPDGRVAELQEQVRGLLYRVWTLERGGAMGGSGAPVAEPAPGEIAAAVPSEAVASLPDPPAVEPDPPVAPPSTVPAAPARPGLDLEQRIGARWATWVGIVAILVAMSLFLKWAFDNAYLGPVTRVALGLAAGLIMLAGGLLLHRRRDVPYLSEGLTGGGLGILYLSLFAAHALYGLLGPVPAFAALFAVTLLGAGVAVASSRLSTAVLAVLGGLLTPVLLRVEGDERNLLAYLLVLDALALVVARFRTWPSLNRLAWVGTALLLLPTLLGDPEAPRPLTRLLLLSALFLVFLAVPLFRERPEGGRAGQIDLALVVANAAAYFWAVYVTLEAWRPAWEGPYALVLAVFYRLIAADRGSRSSEDRATVDVHEGVSWTFLTLAVPLALDGQWVTLAWAVQGLALLWLATRTPAPVAAWGGLAALLLAALRAAALDRYWFPDVTPIWNLTFLTHLLVVVALGLGGGLGGRVLGGSGRRGLRPEALRTTLWVVAVGTLAVQLWREPAGLWPAILLTVELLVVSWLARVSTSPAFAIAIPLLSIVLLIRVLGADETLARMAADSLVNRPLLSRVAACAAIGLAGGALARSGVPHAATLGRMLSALGGLVLLFVLSVNWTRYQQALQGAVSGPDRGRLVNELRWRTQIGLSVLWTFYAAAALAWGFLRASPWLRYGALALLGLTVVKVFAVDLAAVKTAYRILSFLILGVVLLLVSLAYQKVRGRGAVDPSKSL